MQEVAVQLRAMEKELAMTCVATPKKYCKTEWNSTALVIAGAQPLSRYSTEDKVWGSLTVGAVLVACASCATCALGVAAAVSTNSGSAFCWGGRSG